MRFLEIKWKKIGIGNSTNIFHYTWNNSAKVAPNSIFQLFFKNLALFLGFY